MSSPNANYFQMKVVPPTTPVRCAACNCYFDATSRAPVLVITIHPANQIAMAAMALLDTCADHYSPEPRLIDIHVRDSSLSITGGAIPLAAAFDDGPLWREFCERHE